MMPPDKIIPTIYPCKTLFGKTLQGGLFPTVVKIQIVSYNPPVRKRFVNCFKLH